MTITPAQVKEARLLLGWTQSELGGQAGVSATTVAYTETDRPRRPAIGLSAIRQALEDAGVIFVEENGEGPGVRLRKGK
jgi:transcriptional regulator with XRE-family HTH domain